MRVCRSGNHVVSFVLLASKCKEGHKAENIIDVRLISAPLKNKIKCYQDTGGSPQTHKLRILVSNMIIVLLIDSWPTITKKEINKVANL